MESNENKLNEYVKDKNYLKVLKILTDHPKNIEDMFYAVEAYLGLKRIESASKLLQEWQFKMQKNSDWASWLFYKGKTLLENDINKDEAMIYFKNAQNFLLNNENEPLLNQINEMLK